MRFEEIDKERAMWGEYSKKYDAEMAELQAKRSKIVPNGQVADHNRGKARELDDKIAHKANQQKQIDVELKRLDEAWATERARIKELLASRARLAAGLEPGAISEAAVRKEDPDFVLADHRAELESKIAKIDAEVGAVQHA